MKGQWQLSMNTVGWIREYGIGQTWKGRADTQEGAFTLGPAFGIYNNPGAAIIVNTDNPESLASFQVTDL